MKKFELRESEDGWHTVENGASYHYKFPKSYELVMREIYRHETFYGKGFFELFRGERELFKLWSCLIAAIAVPLDE